MMYTGAPQRLRTRVCAGVLGVCAVLGLAVPVYAQRALSVTVTPPLFQLTIGPGESWASTVKIVNDNSYDVSYYATVMDFAAEGEDGQAKFVPLVDETGDPARANYSLAHWLTIQPGPYFIPAGASMEVPFLVEVPTSAEPGGHYASILIGTQPADTAAQGASMKISSYVSSLLFVKIKGDVVEKGRIREFLSERAVYQVPQSDFALRFENIGNTHLKPQGDVTIYNMWGKERGRIDINQKGNFGNVLPKSIRKFQFSWTGESSVVDIGRYSAVVTLAFGQDSKQNVTAVTYFWVIPTIPLITTLGIIIVFIVLVMWMIRRYIRRALELERVRSGMPERATYDAVEAPSVGHVAAAAPVATIETLMEPLKEGVIDLRKLSGGRADAVVEIDAPVHEREDQMTLGVFIGKYRMFLLFVLVILIGSVGAWNYMSRALVPTRGYQITDVQVHEEPIVSIETQVDARQVAK